MLDDSTPDAELVEDLPSILNIDQVLWQLAVSNVFMDDDGYIHKGGDYALYQDVNGRFHLIPHDNNESLRFGRSGRGGPGGGGPGGGWSWGDYRQMDWYLLSPMKTMPAESAYQAIALKPAVARPVPRTRPNRRR